MASGPSTTITPSSKFPSEEAPGLSVFAKDDDGEVFHTYSAYARGLDMLSAPTISSTSRRRAATKTRLPWSMAWVRRHDEYETDPTARRSAHACCD